MTNKTRRVLKLLNEADCAIVQVTNEDHDKNVPLEDAKMHMLKEAISALLSMAGPQEVIREIHSISFTETSTLL